MKTTVSNQVPRPRLCTPLGLLALNLALALLLLAQTVAAQPPYGDRGRGDRWQMRFSQRPTAYLKNNTQIKSLLAATDAPSAAATVRVLGDGQSVALGTIVAADGLVVTKASVLTGKLECRLADGRKLSAVVVGQDEATDLALLRIDAKGLTPIVWSDGKAEPGSLVAATSPGEGPTMIGVVSDVAQPMPGPGGRNVQHGWLGIHVGPTGSSPEVQNVSPNSAAEKAGVKNGDQIKRLDGMEIHTSDEIVERVSLLPPNKKVTLVVERKDKQLELEAILGRSPGRLMQDNWGGGPFSERRWGFATVIPDDLPLSPADCGGPLVDIDGRCLGVNIARALRVASYALPPQLVQQTVEKIRGQAMQTSQAHK